MITSANKKKIINDPVYGFISIPRSLIYDVIELPEFQRLRRIKQLGLTDLVYPGAIHTRFQHAIGAMHLMTRAIDVIRKKGYEITEEEARATTLAILLHDLGHGPFSHTLEFALFDNVHHEHVSIALMKRINEKMDGALDMTIAIFEGNYPKKALTQLISSQLDMDRLDYLKRDSFFTGVSEGVIGSDRLIEMLAVKDDRLVIEEKGIYSIENFLVSRRIMYWQVYLHKTVLAAELMLERSLVRARELASRGVNVDTGSEALNFFLNNQIQEKDLDNPKVLDYFVSLDDVDVMHALKLWQHHEDLILSRLSKDLLDRNLFKTFTNKEPFSEEELAIYQKQISKRFNIPFEEAAGLLIHKRMSNNAYTRGSSNIEILKRDGSTADIEVVADNFNISRLVGKVDKYFLMLPKEILEG